MTVRDKKKQNHQTQRISESFVLFMTWGIRMLITLYVVLILGVLPFYYEEGYTHIGTDKSTFFRNCSQLFGKLLAAAGGVWLVLVLVSCVTGRKKERKTDAVKRFLSRFADSFSFHLTDGFALAYGISLLLSYCFTDYRDTARWGTSGWYMGLIPHLTLLSIYFLVSRLVLAPEYLLYLCMPVSAVTFVLGYCNRFDIWLLPMENSGLSMYISTVGNINWFCGYIVSVLFVGVGLLWLYNGRKKMIKLLLAGYTCLGFGALFTQGSDSGIFAAAVVLLVMFVLSAKASDGFRMRNFWLVISMLALAGVITLCIRLLFPGRITHTSALMNLMTCSAAPVLFLLLALAGYWFAGKEKSGAVWKVTSRFVCGIAAAGFCAVVLMIAVNTAKPGSLGSLSSYSVFTFDDKWGSSRGGTWRLGWACFAEQKGIHKLVGAGPDCMADYLYKGSSEELKTDAQTVFENKRLTNAHNEMLTLLVNVGILGTVTFAGLLLTLLRRLLGAYTFNAHGAVCGLCLLGYIANNIWSFQQSLSTSTIFVLMGLGACFLGRAKKGIDLPFISGNAII